MLGAVPVPHPAPGTALLLRGILQKVLQIHPAEKLSPDPVLVSSQGVLSCALVSGLDGTPFPAPWLSAGPSPRSRSRSLGVRAQTGQKTPSGCSPRPYGPAPMLWLVGEGNC